jgi:hypothetical protein
MSKFPVNISSKYISNDVLCCFIFSYCRHKSIVDKPDQLYRYHTGWRLNVICIVLLILLINLSKKFQIQVVDLNEIYTLASCKAGAILVR